MKTRLALTSPCVLVAVLLLVASVPAYSGPVRLYRVVDLGPGAAYGINNSGQVVGTSFVAGGSNAFVYSGGVITNLGTLGGSYTEGRAINGNGQVTGWSTLAGDTVSQSRAFVSSGGVMTDLGTLGSNTSGRAINNSGQVVGWGYLAGGGQSAFLYSGGAMNVLANTSEGNGINDSGQVVGTTSGGHAFVSSGGVMTDLGTFGGPFSEGYGINDSGQVVGYSTLAGGAPHAFLYSDFMTDLGTLGGYSSVGYAINNSGQVVGYSDVPGVVGTHAFLWSGGTMTDLNTVLDGTGAGWTLQVAYGINDSGQIVGTSYGSGGSSHALLLDPYWTTDPEPVPDPGSSLLLFGISLVGLRAWRKRRQ